jgi:hypothetical protein
MTNHSHYEDAMAPARERFATNPILSAISARDVEPRLLEAFLINFSARGVRMTEPVEGWLKTAAERCTAIGLRDIGQALRGHAAAESGHHLMMIADTHALVSRWNARGESRLDAEKLLAAEPGQGARRYIAVHEAVINGETPYAQVALEYEIEMLPVRYGEQMIGAWVRCLGKEILPCLSFLTEHIELDVGHTKFNAALLDRLLDGAPERVPVLVRAGSEVLDAYGQFLTDCLGAAREMVGG